MINIFETSFEARERRFQIEKLYHGETVDLVGVVTTNGVPQNITGYAVSGVFQPTSAQGSDDFYELSADIVDNKVVVHWEKGKDFGENSYMVWALLTDGDNASYPIVWRLDMAYSPSYPLSDLAPIPKAIDFSKYDLLNAPWLELSAFDEFVDGLSNEYLPLSGGVVSGDFAVENFLSSTSSGVFLGKNQDLDQYAELAIGNNLSVGMVGLAMGSNSEARSNDIAIGHNAKSPYGGGNIVIGNGAYTAANGTTVVGTNAKASGGNAIAIGTAANATHSGEVRLGGPQRNLKPQLWLFDTPILSGPNTVLLPERVPYLSGYAKTEDLADYATQEWVNEQISSIPQPSPPIPAGILTIKQNDTTVAEYNPDTGTNVSAKIYVPTDLSAFTNSPGYLTAHQSLSDYYTKQEADGKFLTAHQDLTDYATKEFVQSEISDFVTEDALTGLATKEEVQAVDDKLSDYAEKEELTAYAQLSDVPVLPEDIVRKDDLSVYAQLSDLENIDVGEMSACLSSDEFTDVEELSAAEFVSLQDIVDKMNLVIQKLKRTWKDPRYTYVYYADETEDKILIEGTVSSTFQAGTPFVNAKRVELGTAVTGIGEYAFSKGWGSSNSILTSVAIPNTVTSIGGYCAFKNCTAISSIQIPDSVTSIGEDAFYGCSELTSIVIPDGVTSIGWQAFRESRIQSISIPNGVTQINSNTFRECRQLSSVSFGTGVTKLNTESFRDCSALTAVTIPLNITDIVGDSVFQGTSVALTFADRTMTDVQAMSYYPWGIPTGQGRIVCTDGTL